MSLIYSKHYSLVNLSNTILAHFQTPTHHPAIPELLKILKGKKKICLLLFDGMGQAIVHHHLTNQSWLRQQYWRTITSTFPSTTAAATNAFLSGKYPIEIGWLGWAQYFKEHDLILELFTGKDYLRQQAAILPQELRKSIDYSSILSQIQRHQPEVVVQEVWPDIRPDGAKSITEFWQHLERALSHENEKVLTYGYWLDPDKSIHAQGVHHPDIRLLLETINQGLQTLTQQHQDTTFIIFADHGLVDIEFLNIQAHPDLFETLQRSFALEPRAATFYVKPKQQVRFKRLFKRYYGRYFKLYSHHQALNHHLYGLGEPHPRAKDFIGDFVAVSHSRYAFTHGIATDTMPLKMKAHHAGMTPQEMNIDVMLVNL